MSNNNIKALTKEELFFLKRRRWARVGVTYVLMICFMMLFLSPLMFSIVSSFKTNPLEYPPSIKVPQLNPVNWGKASSLAKDAGGNFFTGGFSEGNDMTFDIKYFTPEGMTPEIPEAEVPRRVAGGGLAAVRNGLFASDYISVSDVAEINREQGTYEDEDGIVNGIYTEYRITVSYPEIEGDAPVVQRVPMDVLAQSKQVYISSTLPNSRLERRGRVASYDNITPGFFGYSLYNYFRVFSETKSISTGNNLFGRWFLNSIIVAVARVLTNLLFASMAGYALARYQFKGKWLLAGLLIFSQVLPGQVTFISNYLVMRDGIFGLTKLFGVDTLLNTLSGVVIVGAIESAKVFIMKQFFESLPKSMEEAAYIDGAGHFTTFFRIMLPMSRPALGAVTILTFQGSWNDFFWPMIVLTTPEDIRTLPIGILYFRQIYGAVGDWGLILSGAVMSALPVIVLFVVFQKYFLEGVSFGGTKE